MKTHSTTILTVRRGTVVAMGGDGQVSLGDSIMKADANKIRRLMDGKVITGFAGASADAFALMEPTDGVLGIGSGGSYAVAAARALVAQTDLPAAQIVRNALEIAAGIDVYTNTNIVVEELACET